MGIYGYSLVCKIQIDMEEEEENEEEEEEGEEEEEEKEEVVYYIPETHRAI